MCKFWILVICILSIAAIVTANCFIDLKNGIHINSPVILVSSNDFNYRLFKPTGQVSRFDNGANFLLACPTVNRNKFNNKNTNIIQLSCSNDNFTYTQNNSIADFKQLLCQFPPMSTLQNTGRSCANGDGVIYETGFDIGSQFHGPVFEICYNKANEFIHYTHNTLNGAAMAYAISAGNKCGSFTADGMNLKTSEVDNFYKNHINRFTSYFGATQPYVDRERFLARGHLSANGDFILPYEKCTTYFYVNTAPEFQIVNAGNWLRVEQLARTVSTRYRDDIESYNGYIGVLELPQNNGSLVQIYLDDMHKIEVPAYFYKILWRKATDSAIVFVTVNNPYLSKNDVPSIKLCTDVCQQKGLIHRNFPDETKGYTFCCALNEFKNRALINWLPAQVMGKNLLKFN